MGGASPLSNSCFVAKILHFVAHSRCVLQEVGALMAVTGKVGMNRESMSKNTEKSFKADKVDDLLTARGSHCQVGKVLNSLARVGGSHCQVGEVLIRLLEFTCCY